MLFALRYLHESRLFFKVYKECPNLFAFKNKATAFHESHVETTRMQEQTGVLNRDVLFEIFVLLFCSRRDKVKIDLEKI